MIYKGEKYIYIGFVKKAHGEKGKIILSPKRRFDPEVISRVFIKNEKGELEEFRLKLAKRYKNLFILKLSKIKSKDVALSFVSKDVYIKETDIPRKLKINIGIVPQFIEQVQSLPSDSEAIGFITKPRGLHGQVAALVERDKLHKLQQGANLYLQTEDGKLYKTQLKSFKKLKEGQRLYISLKLLHIDDVESAERLRKATIFM